MPEECLRSARKQWVPFAVIKRLKFLSRLAVIGSGLCQKRLPSECKSPDPLHRSTSSIHQAVQANRSIKRVCQSDLLSGSTERIYQADLPKANQRNRRTLRRSFGSSLCPLSSCSLEQQLVCKMSDDDSDKFYYSDKYYDDQYEYR